MVQIEIELARLEGSRNRESQVMLLDNYHAQPERICMGFAIQLGNSSDKLVHRGFLNNRFCPKRCVDRAR